MISSIDAVKEQIVLDEETIVQVTPNTAIIMNKEMISFEELAVGMTVKICGHIVEDVLLATQISVMYKGK